jgi:hypothetical protein
MAERGNAERHFARARGLREDAARMAEREPAGYPRAQRALDRPGRSRPDRRGVQGKRRVTASPFRLTGRRSPRKMTSVRPSLGGSPAPLAGRRHRPAPRAACPSPLSGGLLRLATQDTRRLPVQRAWQADVRGPHREDGTLDREGPPALELPYPTRRPYSRSSQRGHLRLSARPRQLR